MTTNHSTRQLIMLRQFVFIVAALSIVTTVQARPIDNAVAHFYAPQAAATSEPTMLMGRRYQVSKREPLILMDPELERLSEQHYRHRAAAPLPPTPSASPDTRKKKTKKVSPRRVAPFPHYVAGRSLDAPQARSEPPAAAPHSPNVTSSFITNAQKNRHVHSGSPQQNTDYTAEYETSRNREAYAQPSSHDEGQDLGVAGLGLGGTDKGSSGSNFNFLGGLIGGSNRRPSIAA